MSRRLRKIIVVNTSDRGGGAECKAFNLFKGYQARGIESWLLVGDKKTTAPGVLPFFLSPHFDYRPFQDEGFQLELEAKRQADLAAGREDFNYPYSHHLLQLTGSPPDFVHCINLHGPYFDLTALPKLSHAVPVCLTVQDMWNFTGHCGYPFGCERWLRGCGECPDLSIPPAIACDATAFNWERKRKLFAQSRLYVAPGSRWIQEVTERSILAPAIRESRLIYDGVDCSIFQPAPAGEARANLGLPQDAYIALFVANLARSNRFKDYAMLRGALERLGRLRLSRPLLFLAVGEDGPEEVFENAKLRHVPYQNSPGALARYYQAADLYLHPAKAEVFGLVIAEAMACGLPVVASAVGGIPEAVVDGQTGILVSQGDADGMARGAQRLLEDPGLRSRMGRLGAERTHRLFNLERVIEAYVGWFEEVLEKQGA